MPTSPASISDINSDRITYSYAGDGTTTLYPILWPYLNRDFVRVTIRRTPDDEDVEDISSTVSWLSDGQIEVYPPPPSGSTLTIARVTPSSHPLAVFKDGSTQLAVNMNTVVSQLLHIVEEGRDYTERVKEYVGKAEVFLAELLNLSIAVGDSPYGSVPSSSYNPSTGLLTIRIPEGMQGPQGFQGVNGEDGKDGKDGRDGSPGPQGEPGEMGGSPLPMAFGQFRINRDGILSLAYSGSIDPDDFSINSNGELEVQYTGS